jgi:hypothetical protein
MHARSGQGEPRVQPRVSAVDDNSVISGNRTGAAAAHARPSDWKQVEDFLTLLARAVQQLHTYPASSPLCTSAIESCQRALVSLGHRDQLTFRVTPSELLVDDIPVGRGTQVGHELARRLHKAAVAAVTLEQTATSREIARFCEDLVRCADRAAGDMPFIEMLTEHGVERLSVKMSSKPEVLELTSTPATAAHDLDRERARFNAQLAKGGVVNHLYPPQKGWVRLDPGSAPGTVSLLDLAVLADDPATLATMLLRLTDEAIDVRPADALEQKYSDVAMLLSALDPRVARRMFAKLARAVLDLEPQSRQALLRRTVLPGLLDGRVDGAILQDFPDVDLAESLCLLLDLETAAPELLTTALSRLDLSPERHASIVPLLEERLKERELADSRGSDRQSTLARHARELVRVDGEAGKSFADFAAFDLSLDEAAIETLGQIRETVPRTDTTGTQLTCLWHLICLEPNPDAVNGFLARSLSLLNELERGSRGAELPRWLAAYRQLAERLWGTRPDVSGVIGAHLAAFCTPARAAWIADLSLCEPGGRQAAGAVITALGPAIAPPLVEILEHDAGGAPGGPARGGRGRGRAVTQLLQAHAADLGPALAALLEQSSPAVRRTLLRVLGTAGAGYENFIGAYVTDGDEGTAREALRALARLGTSKAAGLVVAEIQRQRGPLSVAAEETLWHFPLREAQRHTRELLGRRDFAVNHPHATERLLDRAARAGSADLTPVLIGLAPLRFRLWNPALARVARKANAMLKAPSKAQVQP